MTSPSLPVAPSPRVLVQRRPLRAVVLHLLRLALFATIILQIHRKHQEFETRRAATSSSSLAIDAVLALFPNAARLSESVTDRGGQAVLDNEGKLLGYAVQSAPQSDRVVGFSGSTNVLIGFDAQERVLGVRVLHSRDTREHVAHVERHARFLSAWNGLTWDEAARLPQVDAVSGATLTSLAIVEGVTLRLGGQRPSLRFPDELRINEVTPLLPDAAALRPRPEQPAVVDILDAHNLVIGFALRTTPAADAEIGYQGPTDTLLVFDANQRVAGISIRKSYDNEPYVGYVRDEASFAGLFVGRSVPELSKLDPKAEGIEGVSGATMTSMAVARGIAPAVRAASEQSPQTKTVTALAFKPRDLGTALMLALASIMSFTRLRGVRWLRIVFQLGLIGYLGFINGDLLSQASLVGWAQAGVPWRSAPGLTLLTLAALLVPACSRTQLYCHQLCPFGAAQQLLTQHALKRRFSLQANARWNKLSRALQLIPGVLLSIVIAAALHRLPINLVALEPFDAFHLRIAGVATVTVAIIGLLTSAFIPMAYCRFGCPTGAMLSFLRFHSRSDCWSARDSLAVSLLVMSLLL